MGLSLSLSSVNKLIQIIFLVLLAVPALAAPTQDPFSLPATWKDEQSSEVRLSQWKGEFVVMTMSYTNCKKVCPQLTIEKLKTLEADLLTRGIHMQIVVVTFDPESDTPAVLAEYKKKIDRPSWHFLSGNAADTRRLAATLGLDGYFQMDDHIIHDFKIWLFAPSGKTATLDWNHRDADAAIKSLL